jgi:hypothetical protein
VNRLRPASVGFFEFRSGVEKSGTLLTIVAPKAIEERAMGRFYLNTKDGSSIIPDDEGLDLPDVEAAEKRGP